MTKVPKVDEADTFAYYWRNMIMPQAPQPIREYKFALESIGREWRLDFAWPDKLVAVEIDGNAWNTKGGGRHGRDEDREKLNVAATMGYRVFHFSPKQLADDPTKCLNLVMGLLLC